MVSHTGNQVKHISQALQAIDSDNRAAFDIELRGLLSTMQAINRTMETMWGHSKSEDYLKFRTFIMGTKNQPMVCFAERYRMSPLPMNDVQLTFQFPNGVIYEGVSSEPTFYRGESGANDSIIPSSDNFLEITERMPENPLTEILRDFRTYRPTNHNEWLAWLEAEARRLGVRKYALKNSASGGMLRCASC
jgi:indoleamine 2,3-dioxygenase